MSDLRRSIPSIDRLLLDPTFEELLSRRSRALIVSHLRRVQEELREEIARGVEEIPRAAERSEEHTSELQSRGHLVCRLLLEKKKQNSRHGPRQLRRRVEKA